MKIIAIIQARMGSTRLPGKVLMDLGGETVLARVVSRLRRAMRVDEIVVATTNSVADDAIVRECSSTRRSPLFAAPRMMSWIATTRRHEYARPETVVRITSDCPVIDPQLVDETIGVFQQQRGDYASNVIPADLSPGVGCGGLHHGRT